MNKKNILECWPYASPPRPNQTKALEWMAEQTAKYIILEAPVGSGKSLIGLTYSAYLSSSGKGNSFVITPQRILQEQYEHTYDNQPDMQRTIASLYGKANYTCNSKNATCDIGSLVNPRCDNCPFSKAFGRAKSAPNVVFNYKLALLHFGYTHAFDPRKLMILDECHTIEEHLTEFNATSVFQTRAEKFGVKWKTFSKIPDAHKWIKNTYLPKASKFVEDMFEKVEPLLDKAGSDLSAADIKLIRDYNKLEDHIDDINSLAVTPIDVLLDNYVLVHDPVSMKFKQLSAAENFDAMLNPNADRFLFMSSTILNHEKFCEDLGIDPNDAAFLSLDSDFPKESRPVYYAPIMKMNASWKSPENKTGRKEMVDQIIKISELHEGESGIIHTGNFAIADWLVKELEYVVDQQVLHHNPSSGDDRNAIINQFTSDPKPTILISPSITEGLDLYGDLARFAIFAKIPFGFLGDQWIKRRMELSTEWYQRRAIIDIIQGGGRVMRSKDDWGYTYILDGSWGFLYSQTKQTIPQWWRDGYQRL